MSDWYLLKVMLLKEVRTTFRERSQMRGLLVSVVILVVAVGGGAFQALRQARSEAARQTVTVQTATTRGSLAASRATTQPAPENEPSPKAAAVIATTMRWVAIGIAALAGFFLSNGYLLSAVLASFVGEKEGRTLEILLASPLSDRRLFLVKCISVLLPSVIVGYLFAVVLAVVALAFVPLEMAHLSAGTVLGALLLALPIMVLPQIWFVGLGAAISVRAETMKGAGQMLGMVFLFLFFGGLYGVPLILRMVPSARPPLVAVGKMWLGMPFIAQYGLALLALGIPAAICMAIGRASFRRDRMLT